MQPGETIQPTQTQPDSSPTLPSTEAQVTPAASQPQAANVKDSGQAVSKKQPMEAGDVSWEGSEYVEHVKPTGWYLALVGLSVLVAAMVYALSRDLVTTFVIGITAVLFGVMAARKPRVLSYLVNRNGITIGQKHYTYGMFKTFSVIDDNAIHSVQLLPLKRFMPALSLYYPPELETKIIETLGTYLPFAEGGGDPFDRFMAKIHF